MTEEIVKLLHDGRELISDPERWTQRVAARSKSGHSVLPHSRAAVKWCAHGALDRITQGRPLFIAKCFLARAAEELGHGFVVSLNDYTDHATVMTMFDRAIELAKEG